MATKPVRIYKMTDSNYFPTVPATEADVRSLHDAMIQEVFDKGLDYSDQVNAGIALGQIPNGTIGNAQLTIQVVENIFTADSYVDGYYKLTVFDTPTAGNITETIKKTSDDSTYATKVTLFNTPSAGNIQETFICSALGVNTVKTTQFDIPSVGNIKISYT